MNCSMGKLNTYRAFFDKNCKINHECFRMQDIKLFGNQHNRLTRTCLLGKLKIV